MYYKPGQQLQDRQAKFGAVWPYEVLRTPQYMNPAKRHTTGVITQQANSYKLDQKVAIRSPQYTNLERKKGTAGIIEGRNRFKRLLRLLNDIQHETNCFPEPIDILNVHNREDFDEHEQALAQEEPLYVFEWLEGRTLDRFGKSHTQKALFDPSNIYWFRVADDQQIHEDKRIQQVHLIRLSKLIRGLAIHCKNLVVNKVVHIDIKPEHILILSKDEVPRLLGMGHLAPLNNEYKLAPNDPVHAFTTAGYAAPELVSPDTWDQPLDGEAIMLYALGAVALSVIYTGPQADLCQIWREKGRDGIDHLLQDLHHQSANANAKVRHFVQLLDVLLTPDPVQRKAKCNLDQLIKYLDPFNPERLEPQAGSDRQQTQSLLSSY